MEGTPGPVRTQKSVLAFFETHAHVDTSPANLPLSCAQAIAHPTNPACMQMNFFSFSFTCRFSVLSWNVLAHGYLVSYKTDRNPSYRHVPGDSPLFDWPTRWGKAQRTFETL
jgi:hypothetical protein